MANDKENEKKNWFMKHKVLTIIGALLILGIVGGAASGNKQQPLSNNNSSSSSSSSSQTKTQEIAKIGSTAVDGKFTFTVKGITCGKTSVGTNQYLTKDAQGQFCLLDITVKNTGDESQSLLSSNQKLFNTDGKQYSADDTATMYASSDGTGSWYNNINPGNSVEGTIVFDIPKDQTPVTAELHDSALSSGVKVSLK